MRRGLAALQILAGAVLVLVSPVASEMGVGLMVWLALVGLAGVVGGVGLGRARRWGLWASAAAHVGFGAPLLALAVVAARDAARGEASLASAGAVLALAAVPGVALALLWRARRARG